LETFVERILFWNKSINLISRKDEESIWSSHILHSAAILFKVRIPNNSKALDLGTGGGFPGIPLKILHPTLQITLLDSTQKKIKVVQEILDALKLPDAHAIWGRAEEMGRNQEHRGRYDFVFARAVSDLTTLVKWSLPFLRSSGLEGREGRRQLGYLNIESPALLTLKGGDLETELSRARKHKSIREIQTIDLILKGADQLEGSGKKLVVVRF
jgi:16S rRNA (guanine527-N7)-methyltransferase